MVHLAADPRHTPEIWWDTLIPDNAAATANVFEAARRGGMRVVFSPMHVCGMYENDLLVVGHRQRELRRPRPGHRTAGDRRHARPADGPYAVSKVFGESLGEYYAEAYGMEVVVVRRARWGATTGPGATPAASSRG